MLTPQMLQPLQTGITASKLKTIANQVARLDDWGNDDFEPTLDKILEFIEKAHGKNPQMIIALVNSIVNILTTRLYIRDNIKSNPRILENKIERPLFVTGLPRTGTTMMHRLFAADKRWRVLQYWELLYPYRREDIPDFDRHALMLAENNIAQMNKQNPEFIKRHEIKATAPEECFNILRLTFHSIAWGNEMYSPDYIEWYSGQDMTPGYQYYKDVLKLQLWRRKADHLLLKCPAHLLNVDVILNVFEDGNIVWMHRDPCKSIASGLSLLAAFMPVGSKPDKFFKVYMDYFETSLRKAMNFDSEGHPRLRSVSYKKAKEHPVEVINELYDYWNYDWQEVVETNITNWQTQNPQHKHGVHKYSLEQFGLTKEDIHTRFAFYYDAYGELL